MKQKMLQLIEGLERRINPRTGKLKEENKKSMEELVKNTRNKK